MKIGATCYDQAQSAGESDVAINIIIVSSRIKSFEAIQAHSDELVQEFFKCLLVNPDKGRMCQHRAAAGIVDQANRLIHREKTFWFIAGNKITIESLIHTLHISSCQQSLADMRTADRTSRLFSDFNKIERAVSFIA